MVAKQRVIAEAALARALIKQLARALAAQNARLLPRQGQRHGAHEAAGAVGDALHVFEQQVVVGLIVAMVARVARAVHARRAVQRVHAQAAVVRQRGQARGA